MLRGFIFDLDGTLLDTRLDFAAIRSDLGLPPGTPILEALELVPPGEERDRQLAILHQHELAGARQAVIFDGVIDFLQELDRRGIPQAVFTRNSRVSAELALEQLPWTFSEIITREDAAPKPDPAGLLEISRRWQIAPHQIAICGDYLYDLEAGRSAGMMTILYAPNELPHFADRADHILRHFTDGLRLLDQLHVDRS